MFFLPQLVIQCLIFVIALSLGLIKMSNPESLGVWGKMINI